MGFTIDKYLENLELVMRNLPNKVESIIQANAEQILDLNRQDQLYDKGEKANHVRLKEYAYFTVQIKQLLSQPYDRTTLFYSGQFYEGFYYKFDQGDYSLEIYSHNEKAPELVAKYGKEIFGLNDENRLYLNRSILKPKLDEWLLKYL